MFKNVDDRVGCSHSTTPPHGRAKVLWTRHAIRSGEHLRAACVGLRGQFGATLAAASAKDGAAGAGTHAKPETMHLCAAAIVRLESSLAHSGISKAQLQRPERSWLAVRLEVDCLKVRGKAGAVKL
jgi:hypothetical protein